MSLAGLALLQERRHITNLLCTPEGNSVASDASSGTFAKALSPYWLAQVAGWCAGQGYLTTGMHTFQRLPLCGKAPHEMYSEGRRYPSTRQPLLGLG